MSSHREAPEISKDPVADNTDSYVFVSPDKPDTVTIIANYIPLEGPAGGPNFYEFGDDVLYAIHIDTNGDGFIDEAEMKQMVERIRNMRPEGRPAANRAPRADRAKARAKQLTPVEVTPTT